ncbi:hypothetical protein J8273_0748 [Carpediemonas membranifera]|uniref:Uncharacterized protein n=1 Tax=Carpediemonas membranifera TaxID=201153 RepID=A0A8J6AZ71_9EUKA|nr:hypothetical protein J8273_0748 [Carpediemonas membranifera]|eukprot:KAG9397618.1 hypothetical protein J8273_0748 [Carpediemonas membranifera]
MSYLGMEPGHYYTDSCDTLPFSPLEISNLSNPSSFSQLLLQEQLQNTPVSSEYELPALLHQSGFDSLPMINFSEPLMSYPPIDVSLPKEPAADSWQNSVTDERTCDSLPSNRRGCRREWVTDDITDDLNLGAGTEEDIKQAIMEHKDASPIRWHSKGTTNGLCPCKDKHNLMIRRFKCAGLICEKSKCSLEIRYSYCSLLNRVFLSTTGSHRLCTTPAPNSTKTTKTHRLGSAMKEQIAEMLRLSMKPGEICRRLATDDRPPTLRQVQTVCTRLKRMEGRF